MCSVCNMTLTLIRMRRPLCTVLYFKRGGTGKRINTSWMRSVGSLSLGAQDWNSLFLYYNAVYSWVSWSCALTTWTRLKYVIVLCVPNRLLKTMPVAFTQVSRWLMAEDPWPFSKYQLHEQSIWAIIVMSQNRSISAVLKLNLCQMASM